MIPSDNQPRHKDIAEKIIAAMSIKLIPCLGHVDQNPDRTIPKKLDQSRTVEQFILHGQS